jgi:surface antigen
MKSKGIRLLALSVLLLSTIWLVPRSCNPGLAQSNTFVGEIQPLAPADQTCCSFTDPEPNTAACSTGYGNCVWWVFYKRQRVGNESQDEVDITACRGAYGNPDTWYNCALQYYPHLLSDTPAPHDIVIFTNGFQHTAYVESVNPDGTFNVSQMSTSWSCADSPQYDVWINEDYVTFIHHPGYMNTCCGCLPASCCSGGLAQHDGSCDEFKWDDSDFSNTATSMLCTQFDTTEAVGIAEPVALPEGKEDLDTLDGTARRDTELPITTTLSLPEPEEVSPEGTDPIDSPAIVIAPAQRSLVEPQRIPPASASYRIPKSVFGSGGGPKTSTHYVMNTTQGQSTDLSHRTSASYVLAPGYWSSTATGNHKVYLPLVVKGE